jgi:hypothetical protein
VSGKNNSRREENGEVRHADHNVADKSGGKKMLFDMRRLTDSPAF